jgi:hypothetical protein
MFRSGKLWVLGQAICAIAAIGVLNQGVWERLTTDVFARSSEIEKGEYGGDLDLLRRCWTPPEHAGESNHYLDLWSPSSLSILARVNGLTNNHALFVDSHGQAAPQSRGGGYCFYPRASILAPGEKTSYYSLGDLAAILGQENSAEIRNVIVAGCNEAGRFRSQDVRRYFVNATNVTYMASGELAFKPMFYQAIVLPSSKIKPLYGKMKRCAKGRTECAFTDGPKRGSKPLGSYLADLYLPGAQNPYRTLKAGRERLDPGVAETSSDRADAVLQGGQR